MEQRQTKERIQRDPPCVKRHPEASEALDANSGRVGVSNQADESCSRFPTYHERCRFPKDHFFYNVTSKSCQRFRDYGCPMNVNSYRTLKKCQQFCSEIDVCQMPPEKGDCDNKRHRWFYDPSTKDCKTFTFGGCGGNLNNFNTGRECRLRCRNRGSP
ncbi:kunitz-type protease inhibitor 4 [Pantherophis guttatus]|uniref:Kunitz-type protease inhibitor 4 n=1 Tax=Pantherophis guttatus TaxID=94885 RepID=A0ABM3ZPI7_PANGU|nr:kunitz-type protease inhibitor 4 [Pantherophis guttatus]